MTIAELTLDERIALDGINPALCSAVLLEKEGKSVAELVEVDGMSVATLRKLDASELRKVEESARLCVLGDQSTDDGEAGRHYRHAWEVNVFNDTAAMSYGCLMAGTRKIPVVRSIVRAFHIHVHVGAWHTGLGLPLGKVLQRMLPRSTGSPA